MIDFLKDRFDRLPMSEKKRQIFNLPNSITMLRVGIIPVLFLLLLNPGRVLSLVIALLFIAAALTDLLDGYIARRYNIVTKVGQLMDPIVDKLIISTAMIMLIPLDRIPAWVVVIMIARDVVVDGIRSFASAEGLIIEASSLGKQKTLCQVIGVSALLIHYPFLGLNAHAVGIVVIYIALVLSVWSGTEYTMKFHRESLSH
ncbi:MAG: CDP-diacylglycerol--glycerol-3-phosphate 3-phosphatidyltransferase [Syntrophales bacterium]|nr:CDP-diacylglycerol--glycerol-3-phosphate 3-phosphatidyltransferase [Syntrophales bacterium]MCK9528070.1 CDP-diacylglycerol--glycerol-3-phosphate 3-phosphatidyltransferase [Syntrophales bacterium]MDX9922334.1 CDP-diacylglycerol--glycerol-3-phosphate 3-phosphatidyltransferase [Syntrophales bacterium]